MNERGIERAHLLQFQMKSMIRMIKDKRARVTNIQRVRYEVRKKSTRTSLKHNRLSSSKTKHECKSMNERISPDLGRWRAKRPSKTVVRTGFKMESVFLNFMR
jgi:hypothetical protein